jgi:hypothetical protein
MTDFDLNISSLLAAYRKGLSPVEVVDAVYRRIEAADDPGFSSRLSTGRPHAEQPRGLGVSIPASRSGAFRLR